MPLFVPDVVRKARMDRCHRRHMPCTVVGHVERVVLENASHSVLVARAMLGSVEVICVQNHLHRCMMFLFVMRIQMRLQQRQRSTMLIASYGKRAIRVVELRMHGLKRCMVCLAMYRHGQPISFRKPWNSRP